MNNASAILIPIFIILGLIMVVSVAAFLVSRSRQGKPVAISMRFVLLSYFYLISLISLVILVSGLVPLLTAGLTVPLGRDFSYQTFPMVRPISPPPYIEKQPAPAQPSGPTPEQEAQQQQQQQEQEQRQQKANLQDDIISGSSRVLVAGLIWFFHRLGRKMMQKNPAPGAAFLDHAYLVILLLIFGIVSLVALPNALYQSVRYYFYAPVQQFESRPAPGSSLATAIAFVPFWIYYLKRTILEFSRDKSQIVPEGGTNGI